MIDFNDRNQLFRKSDPTYRKKNSKDHSSPDEVESIPSIKRKGASLVRPAFNRQNSYGNSGREYASKRISVLETSKSEHPNQPAGGMKLMNFIKSSFNLTKSKSKSKLNLNDKPSIYIQTSSKSEEHLNALANECAQIAIKSRNVVLKFEDNTIYKKEYNNNNEEILKPLMLLNDKCLIQPLHPSISNYQNFCFQIIKQDSLDNINKPFRSIVAAKPNFQSAQIAKSFSYNSSFCSLKSDSEPDAISIIRCGSTSECNEWISRLKKHINPNYENTIRHEDLFKIWIQEAKNLIMKKRYFCEIKLDNMLYGRTSAKVMTEMVFWGEEFEFRGLKSINTISISLFRVLDNKKKHDKSELVAQINIPCSDFTETSFIEKWYSPSPDIRLSSTNLKYSQSTKVESAQRPEYEELVKNVVDCAPMVRIKGRYRPLEILPTPYYQPLSDYLVKHSIAVVESLESFLKIKSKEDFVKILLLILESRDCHMEFLSDLVTNEVLKSDDNLILRGNSVASKAMECYMRMTGEKYLSSLLTELINIVVDEEIDCEVDPLRLNGSKDIPIINDHQNKLVKLVENVWNKIYKSAHLLPKDLKTVFGKIRDKLSSTDRLPSYNSPTIDQVISSCLFLRFICPAIMSPFLFGLANEYSDKSCINRTFTLVAKSIQSLANFSQHPQFKEGYMGFMQNFINKNSDDMRKFLRTISSSKPNGKQSMEFSDIMVTSVTLDPTTSTDSCHFKSIDIGYHLAELTFQLNIHLKEIPEKKYTSVLMELRALLVNISKSAGIGLSETDSNFSNISNSPKITSRIPTFQKSHIEIRNKIHESKSAVFRNQSLELDRRFSLPKKKLDIEENFSYIPIRNGHSKTPTADKRTPIHFDSYVDFECCEPVVCNESFPMEFESVKPKKDAKCLNEDEINEDWKKMVTECRHVTENPLKTHTEDASNYTFNSSGYQSLSNFSPDDSESVNTCAQIRSEYYPTVPELAGSLPARVNSPKVIPICQRNIANRMKRNSPCSKLTRSPNDAKSFDSAARPQLLVHQNAIGLSCSRETLEYTDRSPENEHYNLSGSKSMLSLYQKKSSMASSIAIPFNLDREVSHESSDCSLSSIKNRSMSLSSQSFSQSVSMNIDLDPLISNEWKRIKLFLQLFDVPKPTHYHGTAIEQYKQRTNDENHLLQFLEKKSDINQSDIINFLPAAYRLLKSVHKQGKLATEKLTNYLLNANSQIQNAFINHNFDGQISPTHAIWNEANINNDVKLKKTKAHRDISSLSTRSLPFPITKYSKQSHPSESINK